MAILALIGAITMLALNIQQTFAMTGAGSAGQSVDRHLFCNTGVITPICK